MESNSNSNSGVRKGAWTSEEDILLRDCIDKFGEGKWHLVPLRAGLNRCRKSCRLRWLNYLRPNIKRGYFAKDEVDLIIRLHNLLGNRWSLIAGRLPGRTANDVKNFWNTHICKKSQPSIAETRRGKTITESNIVRPRPRTFSNTKLPAWTTHLARSNSNASPSSLKNADRDPAKLPSEEQKISEEINQKASLEEDLDDCIRWWGNLLDMTENDGENPFLFPDETPQIDESTFLECIGDRESTSADHHGLFSLVDDDLEIQQYL